MIRKYKIPFKTKGYAEVIKIPQYDTGYEVVFDVRDLPEGTTTLDGYSAVVEGSRADGLAYEFQCTVSGTHVSFTIDTTCTGCPGRGEARIRFLLSGEEIAANKIIIEIEKSSVPDGAVDADVTEARAIAEQVQEIVDTAAERVEAVYSELADKVDAIGLDVGDLSNLQTVEKTNLVAAINEAAQTGGSGSVIHHELPTLRIYGDISAMTAEKNEPKIYQYIWDDPNNKEQRTGYCSMKWQGESSLTYPKKNYTIKFFHEAKYKRKDKISLFDDLVLKKSKWVIKANWVDRSMARNIVSCRLWGQMVKSRDSEPVQYLIDTPNYGAINGHPIKVYVNDVWHGLYTFNIPKDEDLFGMDVTNPLHCAICGDSQSETGSTAFRSATKNGWELEVPDAWQSYTVEEEGVEVTKYVSDGLVSLINFVMTATDADFKENLNMYLDVESAIDYYLMAYLNCGIDSLGRNLVLLTYDGGNKWYCSLYDADTTWGNGLKGGASYNAALPCPEQYEMKSSLLWERMETCFGDELYNRWRALRQNIFRADYIKKQFGYLWDDISEELYDADANNWKNKDPQNPAMPQWNIDFKTRMFNFIDGRLPYCDQEINAMRTPVACTGITLSESTLSFTSGDPVTLTATVEPADTTDSVVWTSSNPSVATVNNGVVTPVGEGNATITATCGSQTATCSVSVSSLYFTVTLVGTGATLTPTASVNPNAPYTGTLAISAGYALDSIVVEMGGVDITSSAYSNGTITIPHVTGNVIVTVATSVYIDPTGLQYSLASPLIFDGETYVDTGFIYNADSSLSIFVDAENPQDMVTAQFLFGTMGDSQARCCWKVPSRGYAPCLNNGNLTSGIGATVGLRFKSVFRYDINRGIQSNRGAVDGVEKTTQNSKNAGTVISPRDVWKNSLYLGGRNDGGVLTNPMLTGKLFQFRIYNRRLTDSETAALLGVSSLSDVITEDKDPA